MRCARTSTRCRRTDIRSGARCSSGCRRWAEAGSTIRSRRKSCATARSADRTRALPRARRRAHSTSGYWGFAARLRLFGSRDPNLLLDPRIEKLDPLFEIDLRLPADRIDPVVRKIARMHADRARDVLDVDSLAGDFLDGARKLVDGHVLRTADVRGAFQIRVHQHVDAVNHVADVRERSDGAAVAPDFDRAAVLDFRDLSA